MFKLYVAATLLEVIISSLLFDQIKFIEISNLTLFKSLLIFKICILAFTISVMT